LVLVAIMLVNIIGSVKTLVVHAEVDQKSFNIAAVGDISCVSADGKLHGNETISAMERRSNNLVLFLGDLSYSNDMQCFFNMTNQLAGKSENHVLIAVGNHDIYYEGTIANGENEKAKRQLVEKYNIPSSGYYSASFDNGDILVVVMNYTGMEVGKEKRLLLQDSPQYKFVKETLENSTARVKIIASHAPFMTCGCFAKCCDSQHQPLKGVYELYNPLFQSTDVSLVLSGHNHNYQRYKVDNVTYLTDGLGGMSIYSIPKDYTDENVKNIFSTDFGYGFSQFSVKTNSIESKFVSNNGHETDNFVVNLPGK
jgi:predicted phosphodiesterase